MPGHELQIEPSGHILESDIARTKSEIGHIADTIRTRYSDEDQVMLRVQQVQAAIQRLEWALERALETPGSWFNRAE